ncbi:MSMEG_1061 family FMN-dependent PPOX-type flavoprotein [Bradyrhizobium sp. 170]|uniref:MSMEG_1061 family FMN-dependent PPOX-type flavoprotein n=1 Tax=Bradyrhizobium sp. 170 TaxID=2782641 RepID=UPI001FFE8FE6|nr:MSMEG_1061 family FMN-dependent PPOX-type flavoprotein [Bradyrhizobium sp. 170]UPK04359.1 pyridoxamine 5'-phosphate oxidase family protein [Bradyrhizobium sp. 170]
MPLWPPRCQEDRARFRGKTGARPSAASRHNPTDEIASMSQVKTVEQLRNVLPEPRETTKAKILPFLDEQAIDFLQTCPFGLMATAGRDGPIEVSPKGDEPGFVRVEDERTVLLPERAGNNLAFGLQNILETGRIGMIFLRPRTGETLRLSGRAEIFDDAELLATLGKPGRPALLAIRIHVERCYFHCARSVIRSHLWEPDRWPEAKRISFGKIFAARTGGDEDQAAKIDAFVETGYTTNLWSNG